MGNIKEINIKNRTYYFFSKMINIKVFDSSLLKIDKNSCKNIGILKLDSSELKKVDVYENIHSVNPLYLIIGKVDGYIEEKNESKYLVFDSTDDKNKELLKKYTELWDGIKNGIIKTINGGQEGQH